MYKIFSETLFLGKEVIHLPSCHSTNDIASDLLARNRPEGVLVITDHQIAGRGQRGHTWKAEPGKNLTFSLLLRPHFVSPSAPFGLHLFVSLALHDWAKQFGVADPVIKWPNDLYAGNHKLGGILIENTLKGSQLSGSVVGIGLNINQTEFRGLNATSLTQETGTQYELRNVLEALLLRLEQRYLQLKRGNHTALWQAYHEHLMGYGVARRYRAEGQEFVATLQQILPNGAAMLVDEEGVERIYTHGAIEWILDGEKPVD